MTKLHPMRIFVALALAGSTLALIPVSPASAAKRNSPADSLMVVTANLEEAWNYSDTQSHWDMDKFVARVLDQSKFLPDVLAVQEVRKSSATYVARKLTRRSGQLYRVIVMPPANPFQPYRGRAGAKETSIIANARTMKVLHDGGMMPTAARPEHVVEPHDPVFFQSYALLEKRASGKKYATMSVHLYPRGYLANNDLDKYYRNKWSKQMHGLLRNKYGGRNNLNYLMAGDFNQEVCKRFFGFKCFEYYPFAKTLKKIGYTDTSKKRGPVDLIWSKTNPGALHGQDLGHRAMSPGKRYSDHAFRWTILGPDRYGPTSVRPVETDLRKKGGGKPLFELNWNGSDDRGGSGLAGFELWKKVNDDPWGKIPPRLWTGETSHRDEDISWRQTIRYKIRAYDRAGNFSSFVRRSVEVLGSNVDKV